MTFEQFAQVELIKQLKYRYVRAMDTHNWTLMETCFTHDATFIPHGGKYQKHGAGEIVAFFDQVVTPDLISSHCVMHPEIVVHGDRAAHGRWRFTDTIHFTRANTGVKGFEVTGGQVLRGAGYYYEEYALGDDGWKIDYLTSVRIFTQLEPLAPDAELTIDPTLGVLVDWPRGRPPEGLR